MNPSIDTVPLDKRTPGIKHIDALIHPRLPELYANRAARLRQLAEGHADADYLRFAAAVVDTQARALATAPPGPQGTAGHLQLAHQRAAGLAADGELWAALAVVVDGVEQLGAPQVGAVLQTLRGLPRPELAGQALALLQGQAGAAEARHAVFLWAALSVTWARRAAALPAMAGSGRHGRDGHTGEHALCPVCGCAPTGSLILTGDRAGLRYLQCSLCETRWHMVRAKCSNCDSAARLDYWSFDQPAAAVKAESCGDCGGYLKAVYLEQDPAAEVVADDLATLALDAAVEAEGYRRTGFNPFALPAG